MFRNKIEKKKIMSELDPKPNLLSLGVSIFLLRTNHLSPRNYKKIDLKL